VVHESRRAMTDAGGEAMTWDFRRRTNVSSEALLRILHGAVTTFDGDLETFVIYLSVTCASVGAALRNAELLSNPPPGRLGAQHYRAVSRRAIAASTGLPRETVRRKIAALIERGALIAQGSYVRIPQGVLEEPQNREFAQMMTMEFSRAAAQLARIPH
jgi:hypothetical protein